MSDTHKYDDIIHLPHPVSKRHPQMTLSDRAAQFSPFAALTGHEVAIQETARQTEEWMEMEEDRKEMLDERLRMLRENLDQKPEITVTYFKPDEKKNGGAYLTVMGKVKKIDEYVHQIVFEDGTVLPIESLFSLEGELFRKLEDSYL